MGSYYTAYQVVKFTQYDDKLYTCDECGALVPDGMCLVDHQTWHRGIQTVPVHKEAWV